MKKFFENHAGLIIRVLIIAALLIFTAGQFTRAQDHLADQVRLLQQNKVDKELYQAQMEMVISALERIEGKIDVISARDNPGLATPGD